MCCLQWKCVEASKMTAPKKNLYVHMFRSQIQPEHNDKKVLSYLVTNTKKDLEDEDSQMDSITVHIVVAVQWPKSNNSKEWQHHGKWRRFRTTGLDVGEAQLLACSGKMLPCTVISWVRKVGSPIAMGHYKTKQGYKQSTFAVFRSNLAVWYNPFKPLS